MVIRNGTTEEYYYYLFNAQGDVIGIVDSTGEQVTAYEYGAWGDITSITGSLAQTIGEKNPIRYRGYYYDTETGFYYLQSRYYDAETQRFLNGDSVISGVGGEILGYNAFAYCHNNPLNKSDNTGNWPKWIKKVARVIKDAVKKAVSVTKKAANNIKKTYPAANHVQKTHVTTPTAMINMGTLFGKVGFSTTVTKQNKVPGLVHSAADIGNNASKFSVGIKGRQGTVPRLEAVTAQRWAIPTILLTALRKNCIMTL